jgi:tetratricopeptide (TPR) repeat protein
VDPHYVDALCDLGSACMALADNQPALGAFQQALALDPQHLETMYNLANLYRQMGEFPQVRAAACGQAAAVAAAAGAAAAVPGAWGSMGQQPLHVRVRGESLWPPGE